MRGLAVLRQQLVLIAAAAIALAGATQPASAECSNYEDYLHWVSRQSVPEEVAALWVQGDYQYVVGGDYYGSELLAADATNKSLPVLIDTLLIPGRAQDMSLSGTMAAVACIADTTDGFYLVDISDPSSMQIVGSALAGYEGKLVSMVDTLAYVVTSDAPVCSLHVVDLSTPGSPFVRCSTSLPFQATTEILTRGDYAYIAGADLLTVNIANPDSAYLADTDSFSGRQVQDIGIDGDYIFASVSHTGLPVELVSLSLADPGNPENASSLDVPGLVFGITNIAIAADVCYVDIPYLDRLVMCDISDPLSMSGIGMPHELYSPFEVDDITTFGNNLYAFGSLTSHNYIQTFVVSSPDPMEPVGSVDTPGFALGVVVPEGRTDIAYVADGDDGVQIVDVSNPEEPVIVDWVDTPGYATDIVLVGAIAYAADREEGLQVIDTSVPEIVGSVDTPGLAVDLAAGDTVVYMADSEEGLRVIDISVPSLPALRGVETAIQDARGVDISADGRVAYVADHGQGVQSVDVSDPDNPWIIDGVKERAVANASKVDVVGDRAYVTDDSLGLVIVDVSDPADIDVLSSIATDETTGDVNTLGAFAFVGSGASMRVVDVQEDTDPSIVGGVEVPSEAKGIFANELYAYVAAGAQGLQVCPTQCGFDGSVRADFHVSPQSGFIPLEVSFYNLSVGYGLSYHWDFGDGAGTSTETDPSYTYSTVGDHKVILEATNGTFTSRDSTWVSTVDEPAAIRYVEDVADDQGGYVRVRFYQSGYDEAPPTGAERYVVQRQDGREWVAVDTLVAAAQRLYSSVVPTPGNGAGHEYEYRVVAEMDEGSWTSEPAAGYSLDNIAPVAPENLAWLSWGHLDWDDASDADFGFHRVYGSPTPDYVDAVEVDTTAASEVLVDPGQYPWFFVSAVDTNGLESDPAAAPEETGACEVADVELAQAVPSPFNPRTVIGYAVPAESRVRLRVYDVSGRLVSVLVDGRRGPGRHVATWEGRDDSGNRVASGVYFYRLDACGKTLRRTMTLLK